MFIVYKEISENMSYSVTQNKIPGLQLGAMLAKYLV